MAAETAARHPGSPERQDEAVNRNGKSTAEDADGDASAVASARAASYLELLDEERRLLRELASVRAKLEESRKLMRDKCEDLPDSLLVFDDGPISSILEFLDVPCLGRCELVSTEGIGVKGLG